MELDKITIEKDQVELAGITMTIQEKQEYKLLGRFSRTPGLRVFCWNHIDGKITEIEILTNKVLSICSGGTESSDEVSKESANVDGRFQYFEALNYSKALKRVEKFKAGKIKDLCNLRPAATGSIRLW